MAYDDHQVDQKTLRSEQIPNAVYHLWLSSAGGLRLDIPGSTLNGRHPDARGETG